MMKKKKKVKRICYTNVGHVECAPMIQAFRPIILAIHVSCTLLSGLNYVQCPRQAPEPVHYKRQIAMEKSRNLHHHVQRDEIALDER